MDTSIVIPASQLTMSAKFQSLLEGDTIYASGEDLSVKTLYDSLTKTIKTQVMIKSRSVPVKFQKVTETRQVATGTVITNKQELQKQTIRIKNQDKQLEHKYSSALLIVLVIILIIGLAGFLVMKLKKYL